MASSSLSYRKGSLFLHLVHRKGHLQPNWQSVAGSVRDIVWNENPNSLISIRFGSSVTEPCNILFVHRFSRIGDVPTVPWTLPVVGPCIHCGAHRFYREGAAFCCLNGQICIPEIEVCSILHFLFTDLSEIACEFRHRARTYNNAFAFTSIGMSIDAESWRAREGKYALKVFGQVFHHMNHVSGSPNTRDLLQLFFLDSAAELESDVIASRGLLLGFGKINSPMHSGIQKF
ncbi:hypothetical protein ACJIZ3_019899 [Penstemon smallii]|uniref:Uncharacterized protein n=1 Tax=Penstemon smallii TaxID=265156 RepID=A0ABD3T429_9LAMI